jgi:3-deoxy-manno-octulosonate cytidylyltransferase (CMP-KDO synthetase)
MRTLGIIPARYASTRFPGKPLADINGKSMIRRVCEQATLARSLCGFVVATDDHRIFQHVKEAGFEALMTDPGHQSGTDRCLEALTLWNQCNASPADAVINIQGDEPFIHPEQIDQVAGLLNQNPGSIATLARIINKGGEIFSPDVVKVVFTRQMTALYFSRAPIPFLRGAQEPTWLKKNAHHKHIGIYGYPADVLRQICALPPGQLEQAESLEQLRWLQQGFPIRIGLTNHESQSIDTPEDLLKITNTAWP